MSKVAVEQVVERPVLKLDLGCGKNKAAGFLGIDRRNFEGVDGATDLTSKRWVFARKDFEGLVQCKSIGPDAWELPDSSVTEVHCSHFLEHLNHNSADPARVRFMNELYRVLIPGGKATIITPHWASNRAFGDFTHADKPVSEMFYYYVSKTWRDQNAPDNDAQWNPDGYSCDFDATWGYALHPLLTSRNQEYQSHALQFWKEAAQDLHATLIAKKG
jgi:SAM-dependent methyltransferase